MTHGQKATNGVHWANASTGVIRYVRRRLTGNFAIAGTPRLRFVHYKFIRRQRQQRTMCNLFLALDVLRFFDGNIFLLFHGKLLLQLFLYQFVRYHGDLFGNARFFVEQKNISYFRRQRGIFYQLYLHLSLTLFNEVAIPWVSIGAFFIYPVRTFDELVSHRLGNFLNFFRQTTGRASRERGHDANGRRRGRRNRRGRGSFDANVSRRSLSQPP